MQVIHACCLKSTKPKTEEETVSAKSASSLTTMVDIFLPKIVCTDGTSLLNLQRKNGQPNKLQTV
uniref:Uncharacterized protein n=1 Tax=Setaria italica TaxID=4555 RepID=K3YXH3_SETIT